MERELIEERGGLRLYVAADPDPFPPDETGDDVESGVYLTTTRNRYFERNPELLNDPGDKPETWYEFPLYMYAHSGVALSLGPFSCPWDSGQVGLARVRRCEHWPTIESAREAASALVESWNQLLSGDVWGFEIEDSGGQHVDSCWGFYGRECVESEARAALGHEIEWRAREEARVELAWAY